MRSFLVVTDWAGVSAEVHTVAGSVPTVPAAQQVATDNFLQARTMFDVIAPDDGATWNTLGSSEEIADLLKRNLPYCRTKLIRRAITSYKPINSEEQTAHFTRSVHSPAIGTFCVL